MTRLILVAVSCLVFGMAGDRAAAVSIDFDAFARKSGTLVIPAGESVGFYLQVTEQVEIEAVGVELLGWYYSVQWSLFDVSAGCSGGLGCTQGTANDILSSYRSDEFSVDFTALGWTLYPGRTWAIQLFNLSGNDMLIGRGLGGVTSPDGRVAVTGAFQENGRYSSSFPAITLRLTVVEPSMLLLSALGWAALGSRRQRQRPCESLER